MKTLDSMAKLITTAGILGMVLGCTNNIGSQQSLNASRQPGAGHHGNDLVSGDWEIALLETRTDAEKHVRLVKMTLPPTNIRELADSKSHYNKAQESMNLFLKDLQSSVLKGKNPSSSLFYTNRCRTARENLFNFKLHSLEITTPGGLPKDTGISMRNIEKLGDMVFDSLNAQESHNKEAKLAARNEAVSQLEAWKFRDYDQIK